MSTLSPPSRTVLFNSEIGWNSIFHSGPIITRILIGFPNRSAAVTELIRLVSGPVRPDPNEQKWIKIFQGFATGQAIDFSKFKIDESWMTEFQYDCIAECRRIPRGTTMSYGDLAAKVGAPRAARAVGSVMRNNRFPLVVPCHRVVSANSLGGFSAPTGLGLKRQLLDLENNNSRLFE